MSAKTAYTRTGTAEVVAASGPMAATAVPVENANEVNIYISVTAAGTTVTPVVEVSPDLGVTWFPHTTLTAITTTGKVLAKISANCGRLMRINWTAVTGSFTIDHWIGNKRFDG